MKLIFNKIQHVIHTSIIFSYFRNVSIDIYAHLFKRIQCFYGGNSLGISNCFVNGKCIEINQQILGNDFQLLNNLVDYLILYRLPRSSLVMAYI